MRIPYRLHRGGRVLRVRWGNPNDPSWDPKRDDAQIVYRKKEITLNPSLRGNHRMALGALIHEVLHDVDRELRMMTEGQRRRRYHNSKSVAEWSLPHAVYNRVAYTLADFLIDNGAVFTAPPAVQAKARKRKR